MSQLTHVIYSSTAAQPFSRSDLVNLLARARNKNADRGVTGMLLYTEGSFFQVLEGDVAQVDGLFAEIARDPRHRDLVTIIREPILRRSFGEWTMGFAAMSASEMSQLVGANDFFATGSCFAGLDGGRAKKLLGAFRDGRWRGRPSRDVMAGPSIAPGAAKVAFAYQPIIDATTARTVAYEAQVRGPNNEPAATVFRTLSDDEWAHFDTDCRSLAIGKAARLGLRDGLHLRFLALAAEDARAAIGETMAVAERASIAPERLTLQVDQERLIGESVVVARSIEEYRGLGLRISIDHFGAGRAGLSLLEPYRPEQIALSAQLVRDIHTSGPRQAILRGLQQTCVDLGIEIVAKYVESIGEYRWLRDEGIRLFQGDLFAPAAFEQLAPGRIPEAL